MRAPVDINATFVTWRNAASDGYLLLWGPQRPEAFPWRQALHRLGLVLPESLNLELRTAKLVLPGEEGRYRIEMVTGVMLRAGQTVQLLSPVVFDNKFFEVKKRFRFQPTHSLVSWSLAAKFALELVARQSVVPSVKSYNHELFAVWQALVESSIDVGRLRKLASDMPTAAYSLWSLPHNRWEKSGRKHRRRPPCIWHPEALLRSFLDAAVDDLMRQAARLVAEDSAYAQKLDDLRSFEAEYGEELQKTLDAEQNRGDAQGTRGRPAMKEYVYVSERELGEIGRWERRWVEALIAPKSASRMEYHVKDPYLMESFTDWLAPINEATELDARTGFWLEAPSEELGEEGFWYLRYTLVACEDPSLAIPAQLVFSIGTQKLRIEQHCFENPQERLLTDLGKAARVFAPIAESLQQSKPEGVFLDVKQAWSFISEASPVLHAAGFDVRLPEQLMGQGNRRLVARLRIRDAYPEELAQNKSMFGMNELSAFEWEAALGDESVSVEEFKQIVDMKQPLVRWHGSWVLVDPEQLKDIESLIDHSQAQGLMSRFDAMSRALSGIADPNNPNRNVEILVEGQLANLLQRLTQQEREEIALPVPESFVGTLRPYQERGAAWLAYQERLGLGCCLADDMGLGKTIQLIVQILNHAKREPEDKRGTLLICPTSVVGNWQREIHRFAPSLHVILHHGPDRVSDLRGLKSQLAEPNTVVITTYGLIIRDYPLLRKHRWAMLVLDEAQFIKNASSKRAQSVRELQASFRVALTGTPIENRLSELWSILDFLNPSLLGSQSRFQQLYAIPIERYNDSNAVESLKKLVGPFLLRRVKTDPSIIQDLPEKMEYKLYCTLTREQASLYQAYVDESMKKIEDSDGITRKGHILALLTRLKQIVDHPALVQKDTPITLQRSGKMMRLVEMLEVIVENGEKALIFTQYKTMGDILVQLLEQALRVGSVAFLHGSLNQGQRDRMVEFFQSPDGPSIFVLSLMAGGTGLNLTAANHVFHFDRWWNPAVENQATDRAFRIGQNKDVQVHKMLSMGTLEEKIDIILEEKQQLSDSIVDSSGAWVTELDTHALRELFSLSSDAIFDDAD
ncbi:MAG: DEAD/DEAH box helicase [Bradymonadales bacterium]|jgi:SNF2 family DNA or RNA helicase